MSTSMFDQHKTSEILFFIEEAAGASYLLGNKDFHDKLESNKLPDGTRVAKIQLSEKYEVVTKKELKKVNGDDKDKVTGARVPPILEPGVTAKEPPG